MHIPRSRSSLSTLLGSSGSAGRLVTIPIDAITRNEGQPRTNFDAASLAALADSIAARGIIQPIAVRQLTTERFEIVAGERRWLAAQRAGLRSIPAIVHGVDDRDSLVLALAENLVRDDLNPLESARAYATLIDEFSMSVTDLARAIGKSRPAVANTLRLLELPDDVLALVRSGALSEGHARALLQAQDRGTQRRLARRASDHGLSVRALEALVRSDDPAGSAQRSRSADLDLREPQRRLARATHGLFGTPATLRRRRNGGIVVELRCADDAALLELVAAAEHLAVSHVR